jgi:hypothetical protein
VVSCVSGERLLVVSPDSREIISFDGNADWHISEEAGETLGDTQVGLTLGTWGGV